MGTFRFKSDSRNHQAIVQPRLYDCLMVTQITLGPWRMSRVCAYKWPPALPGARSVFFFRDIRARAPSPILIRGSPYPALSDAHWQPEAQLMVYVPQCTSKSLRNRLGPLRSNKPGLMLHMKLPRSLAKVVSSELTLLWHNLELCQ